MTLLQRFCSVVGFDVTSIEAGRLVAAPVTYDDQLRGVKYRGAVEIEGAVIQMQDYAEFREVIITLPLAKPDIAGLTYELADALGPDLQGKDIMGPLDAVYYDRKWADPTTRLALDWYVSGHLRISLYLNQPS